jgi:hypothetical protein
MSNMHYIHFERKWLETVNFTLKEKWLEAANLRWEKMGGRWHR